MIKIAVTYDEVFVSRKFEDWLWENTISGYALRNQGQLEWCYKNGIIGPPELIVDTEMYRRDNFVAYVYIGTNDMEVAMMFKMKFL